MPVWLVTTRIEYDHNLIPCEYIEADSAADALIFCAPDFPKGDWPHLSAEEIDAGPAMRAYANLHRLYKIHKLNWDGAMSNALRQALQERREQFDDPSIPDSF